MLHRATALPPHRSVGNDRHRDLPTCVRRGGHLSAEPLTAVCRPSALEHENVAQTIRRFLLGIFRRWHGVLSTDSWYGAPVGFRSVPLTYRDVGLPR
jgi:hypothetical protein